MITINIIQISIKAADLMRIHTLAAMRIFLESSKKVTNVSIPRATLIKDN